MAARPTTAPTFAALALANRIYAAAGRRLDGGELSCARCGRVRLVRRGDGARFLRHGWPTCDRCGSAMTFRSGGRS